ncbi:MAG: cation:proton antiporter [Armatimonadota bacterium]|nr:cation:proton antiporter [Armatimonadota bacterium]MDR7464118.1 cation:proton antiporter [Armatimonadota bacterium]MDR7470854.1 cation:proton antiporter [Armatimonadota bacterium]MDR7473891.1 cation:proton antiporter [Armatimonadota bacterium]MDR7540061.1 cation:proton antiporter [Armatimonadota bacterium]
MPEHHQILNFLLLLALIVAAAKGAGWLSLRLGQPAVLGELLAGVVLGPSLLDLLHLKPFAGEGMAAGVFLLANLGVVLLMFIGGLETDLEQMRAVGRVAAAAGAAGVVVPLLLGLAVALPFGFGLQKSAFMGIVLAATSVSITVQTLIELGQLDSKEGTTLLGAAVVDDVIALLILSLFVAVSLAGGGVADVGGVVLRMAAFFVVAILLGRVFRGVLGRAAQAPVSEGLLAATLVAVLAYAWSAEALGGVAAITGAYLAGVLVAQGGYRHEVEHRLKAFTYALLVPIFFVSIGLQTNARALAAQDIPLALLIILAAVAGKVIGCGAGARLAGFTGPEALRIGVGMISRGEVGLIIAAIGLQTGLLADRGFAIMVITVLATTVITPPLLRAVFAAVPPSEEAAIEAAFGHPDDSR